MPRLARRIHTCRLPSRCNERHVFDSACLRPTEAWVVDATLVQADGLPIPASEDPDLLPTPLQLYGAVAGVPPLTVGGRCESTAGMHSVGPAQFRHRSAVGHERLVDDWRAAAQCSPAHDHGSTSSCWAVPAIGRDASGVGGNDRRQAFDGGALQPFSNRAATVQQPCNNRATTVQTVSWPHRWGMSIP